MLLINSCLSPQKLPALCVCNPHIQESPQPRAPKAPKSLKKDFPGLPARSVKTVSKKSPNTDFVVFLTLFLGHLGLFRHFFDTPGREAREPLWRLFGDFGARGCGDSCIWRLQSQPALALRSQRARADCQGPMDRGGFKGGGGVPNRKEPEGKNAKGKTLLNTSQKKKICSQKIFQKISQKIEDITFTGFSRGILAIFAKSSRKIAFF